MLARAFPLLVCLRSTMVKPLASGLPPRAGNHSSFRYLAWHPLWRAGVKGIKLLCFPESLLPLVLVWVHQRANSKLESDMCADFQKLPKQKSTGQGAGTTEICCGG